MASSASAAEPPAPTPLPQTVSADALPTVQINGVAWDQVVVGDTVYVTGEFTKARPAGSAAGSNEVIRTNLLAYDIRTGVLNTTWKPTLNGKGAVITASADGSRIFVGGSFTRVSGVTRNRIVALDARTGVVVSKWNVNVNARIRSMAVYGTKLYFGGIFTTVGGKTRTRLASVSTVDGTLMAWAPRADAEVLAITAPAGSGKVIVGGKFQHIVTPAGNQAAYGMAALNSSTGALLPWAIGSVVRNAGNDAGIYSLRSDGAQVYGTGYTYGTGGNFEGTFAAKVSNGALVFVSGCTGDTYDAAPMNGVLYYVSHTHNCAAIGGHPQTKPWTFARASAETTTAGRFGVVNRTGNFTNRRAPELLHWSPTLTVGRVTGQGQAAWTVEGNDDYVVLGGEFPKVNGTPQAGLVRFATTSAAPNKQGPQGGPQLLPTFRAVAPGAVRVTWQAAWDRDNRQLAYQVLRGATLKDSTVIATISRSSEWWDRPTMGYVDSTQPAGSSQTYRIRVSDAFANTSVGQPATVTIPSGVTATSAYATAVQKDAPSALWRLGETRGTTAYDWAGSDDLAVATNSTRNVSGAIAHDLDKATSFAGNVAVPGAATTLHYGPQAFTIEAWFRTTSKRGGKIIGFGDKRTGNSSNYDRHIYMSAQGRVYFGVYNGAKYIVSTPGAFNDGQWHHAVGTMGPSGLTLFVDGKIIGTNTGTSSAAPYSGYWRVGGDTAWLGNPYFAGDIDDVAIYPTVLSRARVQAHYTASGRTVNQPPRPTDGYGQAVYDADPDLYWRLGESSGTTAADVSPNGNDGTYAGSPTLRVPGGITGTSDTAVRFDGINDFVASTRTWVDPRTYSLQLWFNTTTRRGGKLIGFGDSRTATSSNVDRHVFMMDDGRLRFGVWTGAENNIDSSRAYNDGAWHQLVATQGAAGMRLYVDGVLVGSDPQTQARPLTGYWRVGGDTTWSGSTSPYFAGSIDEAAVYATVLSADAVRAAYTAGGGTVANADPTAAFASSSAGLKATFDGTGSTDSDGTISAYAWDFGDGGTGATAVATHTYSATGTYEVRLTVIDDRGSTNVVSHPVSVTNTAPTASFTADVADLDVTLDATGSSDADGTITEYLWQLGDGRTSTGPQVNVTYAASGTYTVELTVTDNAGGASSTSRSVTVQAPNRCTGRGVHALRGGSRPVGRRVRFRRSGRHPDGVRLGLRRRRPRDRAQGDPPVRRYRQL